MERWKGVECLHFTTPLIDEGGRGKGRRVLVEDHLGRARGCLGGMRVFLQFFVLLGPVWL